MQTVMMATDADDAATLEQLEQRRAELTGSLESLIRTFLAAIEASGGASFEAARDALVSWCRGGLETHLELRERNLYPAARQVERLEPLLRSLSHEHGLISQLIVRVADEGPGPAAAVGSTADRDVAPGAVERPTCDCHDDEHGDYPELDARAVPHAIRHATVFGAMDALAPGAGLVLVAPHDPVPLLEQISQRWPDTFEVSYRERGPEAWRLLFLRDAWKSSIPPGEDTIP